MSVHYLKSKCCKICCKTSS